MILTLCKYQLPNRLVLQTPEPLGGVLHVQGLREFLKGGCGCHGSVSGAFKMEMPKSRLPEGIKDPESVRVPPPQATLSQSLMSQRKVDTWEMIVELVKGHSLSVLLGGE